MYDTFGESDYQLKIFTVPLYYFNKGQYLYSKQFDKPYRFAGTMGGSLSHFPVGATVPWRAANYNYGKSFIVLCVDMDYTVEIYEFHMGKFVKVTEIYPRYDEIDWSVFSKVSKYPVYTHYGDLLEAVTDAESLREYVENLICYYKEIRNTSERFSNTRKILNEYKRNLRDDDEEAYELYHSADLEITNVRNIINEMNKKKLLDKFYAKSEQALRNEKLGWVGVYLILLNRELSGVRNKDDPELYAEALFAEARRYLEENGITPDEYYAWNQPLKREKKWMQEAFDAIV